MNKYYTPEVEQSYDKIDDISHLIIGHKNWEYAEEHVIANIEQQYGKPVSFCIVIYTNNEDQDE